MYHTYQSLHVRSYTYDAYIYQKDAKAFVSVFLMGEGSLYRPVVGIATFRILFGRWTDPPNMSSIAMVPLRTLAQRTVPRVAGL